MNFLKGNSGKYSTIRIGFFIVLSVVMIGWSVVSIRSGELKPLPESLSILIISLAGVKTAQRFAEK